MTPLADRHRIPKPPAYLRPLTRRWWASVVAQWELLPHHERLLTLAAESWDRGQQAREAIAKDGLTTATSAGGVKLHPAVRVEAEARLAFARLIRELDLDLEPPKPESRPPSLRSNRG